MVLLPVSKVMRVWSGDQRQSKRIRDSDGSHVDRSLLVNFRRHDLHEEATVENLCHLHTKLERVFRLPEHRVHATRQADDVLAALLKPAGLNARTIVEAICPTLGRQSEKVLATLPALCKQRYMASTLSLDVFACIRDNVSLDAYNPLNSSLRSRLKQSISRSHSAVIRNCDSRLTVLDDPIDIIVHTRHAIQQREFTMAMEVHEIVFHNRFISFKSFTIALQILLADVLL